MEIKILKLNEPTPNNRIYTDETIGNALESMRQEGKKSVYGQMGNVPLFNQLDLSKISHYVTDLAIKDGYLIGEIYPMNTPHGKICKELIESFGKDDLGFEFVPSGVGFIEPLSKTVSDYTITSINIVPKPVNSA